MKFRLGSVLFEAGEYDEAIPVLQLAQVNRAAAPRRTGSSAGLHGRGQSGQAASAARESRTIEVSTTTEDLMYWWRGRYESAGTARSQGRFGRLLRA